MLTLENITVQRGNHTALKNITAQLKRGDCVTVIGPNGAGKSTLFDVLVGAQEIEQGKLFFNERDITNQAESERALLISCLFQDPRQNFISSMTVEENGALALLKGRRAFLGAGLRVFRSSALEQKIIERFGREILTVPLGNLSGGQRQLIAFLLITATPSEVLLLDEPTAALDHEATLCMRQLIGEFAHQSSCIMLIITHDSEEAELLGTMVWALNKGELTVVG